MDNVSQELVKLALREDIGTGDITSRLTVGQSKRGQAVVIAKAEGVLSGTEIFRYVYRVVNRNIKVIFHKNDGTKLRPGQKVVTIEGNSRCLLKGERVALNFLGHLSGVATLTSKYAKIAAAFKTRILDTRKTTPGMRLLEKQAVVHGGGKNHRIGLYDMILIKDNHIKAAGGVEEALKAVLKDKVKVKVEIEVSDFNELQTALKYDPDFIMLDNFGLADLKKAVKIIKHTKPAIKIEVSGGINLSTLKSRCAAGVDYISIGALTHSVPAFDFSMKYIK